VDQRERTRRLVALRDPQPMRDLAQLLVEEHHGPIECDTSPAPQLVYERSVTRSVVWSEGERPWRSRRHGGEHVLPE
jgi:hypothetical protein